MLTPLPLCFGALLIGAAPLFDSHEASDEKKAPVPEASLVEAKRAEVRATFAFEEDFGYEKRRELAQDILKHADTEDFRKEPDTRYAALLEAIDLAVSGIDLETAWRAIESLASSYSPITREQMQLDAILALPKVQPSQIDYVGAKALQLAEWFLEQHDIKSARDVLDRVDGTIRKVDHRAPGLKARLETTLKDLEELERLLAALKTLKANPNDPEANLVVGWHYMFVEDDPSRGLPLLARSPESPLATCAQNDIAEPKEAALQEDLGDLWWEWANTQRDRVRVRATRRASYWWETAMAGLSALEKVSIAEKLDKLEAAGEMTAAVAEAKASFRPKFGRDMSRGAREAAELGIGWLLDHQSEAGYWDADGFMDNCVTCPSEADGAGYAEEDAGVTGLALLALMSAGTPSGSGAIDRAILRGARWIESKQASDGLIGKHAGHHFIYGHAIATTALLEAHRLGPDLGLEESCKKAIQYILDARDRDGHGGWRYEVPSKGDSDTSITGWMVAALVKAKQLGLAVEEQALVDSLAFIDEMTDSGNGRVGYQATGSYSSRDGVNTDYPVDATEAMTAVGLGCRLMLGQKASTSVARKHAELLLKALPEYRMDYDSKALLVDWYYWYHGTEAMHRVGGSGWRDWRSALEGAVTKSQRKDGDFNGSWDTDGPWAHVGGRVYTTALAILSLTVAPRS